MERLAVRYYSVEVEHDSLERGHFGGAFSPARMATFNRLLAGGKGTGTEFLLYAAVGVVGEVEVIVYRFVAVGLKIEISPGRGPSRRQRWYL